MTPVPEKRGNFTQNVKSCYEPVKFTCHIENILTAVDLIKELNEIYNFDIHPSEAMYMTSNFIFEVKFYQLGKGSASLKARTRTLIFNYFAHLPSNGSCGLRWVK